LTAATTHSCFFFKSYVWRQQRIQLHSITKFQFHKKKWAALRTFPFPSQIPRSNDQISQNHEFRTINGVRTRAGQGRVYTSNQRGVSVFSFFFLEPVQVRRTCVQGWVDDWIISAILSCLRICKESDEFLSNGLWGKKGSLTGLGYGWNGWDRQASGMVWI